MLIDIDISEPENYLKMVLNIRDRIFKSVEVFSDARNLAH